MVPITTLKLWDKNPRNINKKDFDRLKKQIQDLGQYKPLLVTPDGTVIGGNMRLRAYKELGITDVWVSTVDTTDEKRMIEYALSDNDRAGYYDDALLASLHSEFTDIDWSQYAVDLGEPKTIDDLLGLQETVEDDVPEVSDDPPVSQLGEVYQLGRHRLMCGDSANIENVTLLMNDHKADMVFTDLPYGVSYEGKTKDKLKIDNDTTTDVFAQVLPNFIAVSKNGASYYICCPPGNNFADFLLPFSKYCYNSSTIIWAKNSMVLGHGDYHYQHEPILYGWVKGSTHKFYGDRTQTTLWNIDRPTQSKEHPTMKPIALVAKAINNSSKSDDLVLDLFGGSGSTIIACEQTNRTCFMMELDPKYCDVIRKRYAKFIGQEEQWQTITPRLS